MTERPGLGDRDVAEPQPAGGDLGSRVPKGSRAHAPENSCSFGKSVAECGPAGHAQDGGCGNPRSWVFGSGAPGDQDMQQVA